jgi:hypothetical protein
MTDNIYAFIQNIKLIFFTCYNILTGTMFQDMPQTEM